MNTYKHILNKIFTRYRSANNLNHPFILPDNCAIFESQTEFPESVLEEFDDAQTEIKRYFSLDGTADFEFSRLIYCLIRLHTPTTVVETGVWHGVSSFFILKALNRNNHGNLYSVDLPPFRKKFQVEIGSAVPKEIRDRWNLTISPSIEYLNSFDIPIDIFIHDSEHTYHNMMSEYKSAWPKIKNNGLIISDDIHTNSAFFEFASNHGNFHKVYRRTKGGYLGTLLKEI
jgi:predicted O-methyltransferase YrrM